MLKIYLSSVIIWFLIIIVDGILFKKQFRKSRDILRKYFDDNGKIYGNFKTAINYLLISFIPIIRCVVLISKIYMRTYPQKYIKIIDGIKKNE